MEKVTFTAFKERHRLASKKYLESAKGKKFISEYKKSASRKNSLRKYFQSEKGKIALSKQYQKSKLSGKRKAHILVRKFLEKRPCFICGNEKSHGHHDDYSKPLEVRWVCAAHHKEIHLYKEMTNEA